MAILATKEESPTRTTLEIEVPAEDVEKAFAAVTRVVRQAGRDPGLPQGQGARGGRPEAVRRRDQGATSSRRSCPTRSPSAIEERKLSVLGRPHIEELKWEPPGPDPLHGAARPEAAGRSRRLQGRPGRRPAGRADRRGGREGHRPHPRGARRVPPDRGARRRRRATSRSRTSPAPSSRSWRRARTRGRSATRRSRSRSGTRTRWPRSTTPCAAPRSGETQQLPQDLRRRLSQRGVQGQDRRLPGDARGAEGEAAAGARRRVRGARSPRATRSRRCARRCATRLRHEKEADRRRKFRRAILDTLLSRRDDPGAGGPRRVGDRRGPARLRALPRAERRGSREGGLGRSSGQEARPGRGAARPGVPAARRDRRAARGSRSPRRSSRPSSSGRPRSAASSRRRCASRWPRRAGIEALRDEMRLAKAVDLLIASAKVLPSGMPVEVK